jgi:hypothetical protein
MSPTPDDNNVSNSQLWDEVKYIRRKVDGLEKMILIMFGAFGSVSTAIALFEALQKAAPTK